MSVAQASSDMFTISCIAYRQEWVFFPIENTLSAGKGRMGVQSVGEVCYLRLPCLFCCCSAAFLTKSVTLDMVVYKYQIWDTAGQEKVFIVHVLIVICLEIKFICSRCCKWNPVTFSIVFSQLQCRDDCRAVCTKCVCLIALVTTLAFSCIMFTDDTSLSCRRGTLRHSVSAEILSTAAQLYEKLHCNRWATLKVTQGDGNWRCLIGYMLFAIISLQ